MTSKEYLTQLFNLDRRIYLMKLEAEEYRRLADSLPGQTFDKPYVKNGTPNTKAPFEKWLLKALDKEKEIEEQNNALNNRLTAMYKTGTAGFVDVILSSESVEDLLSNVGMVHKILESDQELLKKLQKDYAELKEMKKHLEEQQAALEQKQIELEAAQVENEELKKKYQAEADKYKAMEDQLEAEGQQLAAEIVLIGMLIGASGPMNRHIRSPTSTTPTVRSRTSPSLVCTY